MPRPLAFLPRVGAVAGAAVLALALVPGSATALPQAPVGSDSLGSAGSAGSLGSLGSLGGGGIRLVDSVTVPNGARFQGTEIGGLSGIDYDPAQDRYVVISDDKGSGGPTRAYTLELPLAGGKLGAPRFETLVELMDSGGPYPPGSTDTESVRWLPGGGLAYTSEGAGPGGRTPFVREATAAGALQQDLALPAAYYPAAGSGLRSNFGFEGMTLSPDRTRVTVISENALVQDGPAAAPGVPSPSRLLTLDRATGANLGEHVYAADPMQTFGGLVLGPSLAGVSELLAIDDHSYLTVERSFAMPRGFAVTIYKTTTDGADDITGAAAITGAERPMPKTAVFDFAQIGFANNIEGITWGPRLPNGDRSLVLVADNNFGEVGATTFYLLAVSPDSGI